MTPRILLNLPDTSVICDLNDNLLSRIIPRYLKCDTHTSEFWLKRILGRTGWICDV